MKVIINLSVHQLVDLVLRKGDIDNRVFNKASMLEGTRIHAYYQKKAGNGYQPEYPLKASIEYGDYIFNIEGRADGIISKDGAITIDEIKSCVCDINEFYEHNKEWHLGQAEVYAYMYMLQNKINEINVLLTYISQVDNSTSYHSFHFSFEEIKKFVFNLLQQYSDFYAVVERHKEKRDETSKTLQFPYKNYRKYQKELIDKIDFYLQNKETSMIEAATGIGKTLSILYPSIKNFGKGIEKIFFTTAKTSGQEIVKDTIIQLNKSGLNAYTIFLTSKENSCPFKEAICNPDNCPYTKGYYDKLFTLLSQMLHDNVPFYDFEYFERMCLKYNMCPFELQLDLSTFCDIIVCDYNYIYDPFVHLQRFIDDDCSSYVLLVDEGHNLISRSRSMYSASIDLDDLKYTKKSLKKSAIPQQKRYLSLLEKQMKTDFLNYDEEINDVQMFELNLVKILSHIITSYQQTMKNSKLKLPKSYKDFYLKTLRFSKIYEMLNDNFCCYINKTEKNISYNIYCISPTQFINETNKKFHNVILFSATLSPMEYYKDLIFDNGPICFDSFPSPFEKRNLNFMVDPFISFKYRDRDKYLKNVCDVINAFIDAKTGNYMLFVPSYEYLNLLKQNLKNDNAKFVFQFTKMNEIDKEIYLQNLSPNPRFTMVCVAVLKGVFSESIDLIGDKLIGVIVLGVGFPQISYENEKIKDYYNKKEINGFSYAYLYPGMNSVTQAVGRLIRSENDVGSILLIDSRYLQNQYQNLFKNEWLDFKVVSEPDEITKYITFFYNSRK